jgi:phosphoglycerate dehydrogenase-like enzyme
MKAVLHYVPGPGLRRLVAALDGPLRVTAVDPADPAGLAVALADAEVLLHVLAPVSAAMMDAAPALRLVQKVGVGTDAIDIAHARARGIAVCNMPGTNTAAVAEMTLSLMLAAMRQLPALSGLVDAGAVGWSRAGAVGDGLREIAGTRVGFLGYGRVPRRLAPVLRALGAEVVAFSRSPTGDGTPTLGLEALLASCDIVSVHLPGGAATEGLLNRDRIGLMKPGAVLVNTARGSIVDETALAEALASGHLAAAGLDVFAAEPPHPDNPLLRLPNVVRSPHVAWLTADTLRRSLAVATENARRLRDAEPLLHRVA